jgi:hypothetical protein
MENTENKKPVIYVVTGGEGYTGSHIVKTILAQFPDHDIELKLIPKVNSLSDVREAMNLARENNGIIVHTMVDKSIRDEINIRAQEEQIKAFDIMGDLTDYITGMLDTTPLYQPGLFRRTNRDYFDRIEAVEFTLSTDDGMNYHKISNADIILTGVSRAGKTPLSIYLAMFGWKVANIPLVKGIQPPEDLFKADPRRVFGLSIEVPQLIAQRKKRVATFGNTDNTEYLLPQKVREEVFYARRIFSENKFTVIHVSNKPVETSAQEIIHTLSQRFPVADRRKPITPPTP